MITRSHSLLLGAAALFLAACRTPAPPASTLDVDAAPLASPPELAAPDASAPPNAPWWERVEDPALRFLLDRALAENREYRAAEARLRRARALRKQARAARRPEISASGSSIRIRPSTSRDSSFSNERTEWEVGVSADWELDLFGRLRGTVASAEARQRIEHERQRDAALQLVSEVARGYYEYRGIARQQRITQQNLDLLRKTTTLAQKLFDMGETSEFDVVRARGQRQLIQARLPELDARRHDVSNRLAALLAMNARDLRERLDQADAPRDLPSPRLPGLRSDLLRRRPDVRAAKAALDAATADAGAARADRFPRFSLVGQIGRTAESASDLADSDSDQTRGGLVLDWPIWEGGALRAREDIREAEVEEALARYEQQVLDAFADVETALVAFLRERDIAARLGEAEVSSLRAVTLARDLYNAGEETFLSVLDAERELISVQDQLTLSETRVALALVHLYTALGGSWTLQDLHP